MIHLFTLYFLQILRGIFFFTCTTFLHVEHLLEKYVNTQQKLEPIKSFMNESQIDFTCNLDREATVIITLFFFATTFYIMTTVEHLIKENAQFAMLLPMIAMTSLVLVGYATNIVSLGISLPLWIALLTSEALVVGVSLNYR